MDLWSGFYGPAIDLWSCFLKTRPEVYSWPLESRPEVNSSNSLAQTPQPIHSLDSVAQTLEPRLQSLDSRAQTPEKSSLVKDHNKYFKCQDVLYPYILALAGRVLLVGYKWSVLSLFIFFKASAHFFFRNWLFQRVENSNIFDINPIYLLWIQSNKVLKRAAQPLITRKDLGLASASVQQN